MTYLATIINEKGGKVLDLEFECDSTNTSQIKIAAEQRRLKETWLKKHSIYEIKPKHGGYPVIAFHLPAMAQKK